MKFSHYAAISVLAVTISVSLVAQQAFASVGTRDIPTPNNVLCIFNSNSQISKDICSYYVEHRSGARSLGLNVPNSAFEDDQFLDHVGLSPDGQHLFEQMTDVNFNKYVAQPVIQYADKYPEITHIAVAKALPTTLSHGPARTSATTFLQIRTKPTTLLRDLWDSTGWGWDVDRSCLDFKQHFNPEDCKANKKGLNYRFAVSYLTGYTLTDIEKMIDRAVAPQPDLTKVAWLIETPMFGEKDALLDPILEKKLKNLGYDDRNIVFNNDLKKQRIYNREIISYGGGGRWHPSNDLRWISGPYSAVVAPVANRAIIDTYESFFSTSANTLGVPTFDSGKIADAISPQAFGGEDYSHSFSGGVGTVSEPGGVLWCVRFDRIFASYASGMTLAESLLGSNLGAPTGMAVGDPLMRIDPSALVPRKNTAPTIRPFSDRTVTLPFNIQVVADADDDGLPGNNPGWNLSFLWSKISGPGAVTIDTLTPSGALANLSFSEPGQYVVGVSVSDGVYSASTDFKINALAPNIAPRVNAGTDINVSTLKFPVEVQLGGSVSDEKLSVTSIKKSWEQKIPMEKVPIGCADSSKTDCLSPKVSFTKPGKYFFRLSADDGSLSAWDNVMVNVVDASRDVSLNNITTDVVTVPKNKFSLNDYVRADLDLNVRSSPSIISTNIVGKQYMGLAGQVVGGPVTATGYTWWKIDFDLAPDGWVAEENISKRSVYVTKSDRVSSQNILANGTDQVLGGITVTALDEPITIKNIAFLLVATPQSSIPVIQIKMFDDNGKLVAGPIDANPFSSSGIVRPGQTFSFIDSITFPVGKHNYVIKGKLPSEFANNTSIYILSTPYAGWTNAVGQKSGKVIDMTGVPRFYTNVMKVYKSAITVTPSVTPVVTPRVSPLVSPSVTPSPTISPYVTPVTLVIPSVTPVVTPRVSPTVTPFVMPSTSPYVKPVTTPSPTAVISPTPSPTATPSLSPTPTVSPISKPSPSPSPSPTRSPSASPLSSKSAIQEGTANMAASVWNSVINVLLFRAFRE